MFKNIFSKIKNLRTAGLYEESHEICINCGADLTMQRGYSNELPYWVCKGCGKMLINPELPEDQTIIWLCDKCGTLLNTQEGFKAGARSHKCTECGFENSMSASDLYVSENEYNASLNNPYRGMSEESLRAIFQYTEISSVAGRPDIILVESEDGTLFVKKLLKTYDPGIYRWFLLHPLKGMPRIYEVHEGNDCLVVIEEYIKGKTIEEMLKNGPFETCRAAKTAADLCDILIRLHNAERPLIHMDIKPSNVMISDAGEVYLLDLNAAKWCSPAEADNEKHFGTKGFAAPEQAGYGLDVPSEKTDVYSLGILLNYMVTGEIPKNKKADGPLWQVIERCIRLDPDERPATAEVKEKLVRISEEEHG